MDNILNRGVDPNATATKNAVVGSVAGELGIVGRVSMEAPQDLANVDLPKIYIFLF